MDRQGVQTWGASTRKWVIWLSSRGSREISKCRSSSRAVTSKRKARMQLLRPRRLKEFGNRSIFRIILRFVLPSRWVRGIAGRIEFWKESIWLLWRPIARSLCRAVAISSMWTARTRQWWAHPKSNVALLPSHQWTPSSQLSLWLVALRYPFSRLAQKRSLRKQVKISARTWRPWHSWRNIVKTMNW